MSHAAESNVVVVFLYILKLIVNKTDAKRSKREIHNYIHRNQSSGCYLTYQSKINDYGS